jgi:hypothetical protein
MGEQWLRVIAAIIISGTIIIWPHHISHRGDDHHGNNR